MIGEAPTRQTGTRGGELRTMGLGPRGENLSIMIPNYNGGRYIADTISSLTAQGDTIANAQITVIDNASTDDSEAVVKRVGGGRIGFFRRSENVGSLQNHNDCFVRAERDWVHILHSDDFLLDGAYARHNETLQKCPQANLLIARCVFVSENGIWEGLSERLGPDWAGELVYDPLFWSVSPVQFVGILARRETVLALGGFDAAVGPATDWDLWWRIARQGKTGYSNHCVGAYRASPHSDTTSKQKTAELAQSSLQQLHRMVAADGAAIGGADRYARMFDHALMTCRALYHDPEAFAANVQVLRRYPQTPKRRLRIERLVLGQKMAAKRKHQA